MKIEMIPQQLLKNNKMRFCPKIISCIFVLGIISKGHFCKERAFVPEVTDMVKKLVPCTRRIWQLTKVKGLFKTKSK